MDEPLREEVGPGEMVKVLARAAGLPVPENPWGTVLAPGWTEAVHAAQPAVTRVIAVQMQDGSIIDATSWSAAARFMPAEYREKVVKGSMIVAKVIEERENG